MKAHIPPSQKRFRIFFSRPGFNAALFVSALSLVHGQALVQAAPLRTGKQEILKMARATGFGDIDQIRKRGFLRVLVVPNKTHYLIDKGQQFGIAVDMMRGLEKQMNTELRRQHKKYLPVVFIPVRFDEIINRLAAGQGDLAIANITVTDERSRLVDFSVPFIDDVTEILARSPTAPAITHLEDLSGKTVFLRRSSSYYQHLQAINEKLAGEGKESIRIRLADPHIEPEDKLEMLNAGLIQYSFIDRHIGEFWQKTFNKVVLQPEISLASGQTIAWAVRKNTPQLQEIVNQFLQKNRTGTATGNTVLRRYLHNTKWVRSFEAAPRDQAFQHTVSFFMKYCTQYGLDPLMMLAQGFQESGLHQQARSRIGAVGIMQVMPATGRKMNVGDIENEEANIHAGIKFMRMLFDQYFNDPLMNDFNRTLFTIAAYNSGPGRIMQLRHKAAEMGFDPNIWFNNVETVAAMTIGQEPVQYVANISKYYIAYSLLAEEDHPAFPDNRRQ